MPDYDRSDIPASHPLGKSKKQIDVKRTRGELDSIFNFGESELERDDVEVDIGGTHGVTVDTASYLDDDEFEAYTESARESDKLGYNQMNKSNYPRRNKLDTPAPFDVHQDRSKEAAQQDTRREATVTTDPETYASDPTRYDFPFVDTTAEFKQEYANELNPFQAVEEDAGPDDLLQP
jgi:hypothetical protein